MLAAVRIRLSCLHLPTPPSPPKPSLSFPFSTTPQTRLPHHISATPKPTLPKPSQPTLFIPPGLDPDEVTDQMILPGSNIVVGPYAGDSKIKQVEFVGSSVRPKDCPKDERPEFAMLGRSNVGKSSLINTLVRKKEVALTSKKPGLCFLLFFCL